MRPSGRAPDELRAVSIEAGVTKHAEGSCLIRSGDTHVLITASVDAKAPSWMRNSGLGWVTAEYGMLPRATNTRNRREASAGEHGRDAAEIDRIFLAGNDGARVTSGIGAFRDAVGTYAELGVTDLVIHHPRADDPFWNDKRDTHISVAVEQLQNTRPAYQALNPAYGEVAAQNVWGQIMNKIALGELDSSSAADEAIATIQTIFDDWQ